MSSPFRQRFTVLDLSKAAGMLKVNRGGDSDESAAGARHGMHDISAIITSAADGATQVVFTGANENLSKLFGFQSQ